MRRKATLATKRKTERTKTKRDSCSWCSIPVCFLPFRSFVRMLLLFASLVAIYLDLFATKGFHFSVIPVDFSFQIEVIQFERVLTDKKQRRLEIRMMKMMKQTERRKTTTWMRKKRDRKWKLLHQHCEGSEFDTIIMQNHHHESASVMARTEQTNRETQSRRRKKNDMSIIKLPPKQFCGQRIYPDLCSFRSSHSHPSFRM